MNSIELQWILEKEDRICVYFKPPPLRWVLGTQKTYSDALDGVTLWLHENSYGYRDGFNKFVLNDENALTMFLLKFSL